MDRDMRSYDRRDMYSTRDRRMASRDARRDRRRQDMRNDYNDMARGRRDYGYSDQANYDSRRNYDRHYGNHGVHEPVEFMGYCSGYAGPPTPDRGNGHGVYPNYYYDTADRRSDYGDYGETLTEEELEQWCKKLKEQLNEQEKQMFNKEVITQRAMQMGKPLKGFGAKELEVATLMMYTDYKDTIGQDPDMAIKLAFDWLNDNDVEVKGAEKLAVYYDCIVTGD